MEYMFALVGYGMNLEQLLEFIRTTPRLAKNITRWEEIPEEAQYEDFPMKWTFASGRRWNAGA